MVAGVFRKEAGSVKARTNSIFRGMEYRLGNLKLPHGTTWINPLGLTPRS